MDGKELMLNNWVLWKGEPIQVTLIGEHGIQSQTEDRTINAKFEFDIRPIQLTPKILEKCGFKKLSRQNTWVKKYGMVTIELDKDGSIFIPFIKQEDSVNEDYHSILLSIEIMHLHQLQNLIFSLTGNPLQITL